MIERDNDQRKLEDRENQLKIASFLLSKTEDPERRRELRERINKELRKLEGREVESSYLPEHILSLKLLGTIRPLIRITQRVKRSSISKIIKKVVLPLLGRGSKKRGVKDLKERGEG